MAQNLIPEVAKLLGVEMGEDFIIKYTEGNIKSGSPYHLEKSGGLISNHGGKNYTYLSSLLIGELEIQKSLLTNKEKEYLENVLRPFKDRVVYIKKTHHFVDDFLCIVSRRYSDDSFKEQLNLPLFVRDSMYKNMKPNREYTLEELGLFEDE